LNGTQLSSFLGDAKRTERWCTSAEVIDPIAISTSRKGNPCDNAAGESFLKTLKYEQRAPCSIATLVSRGNSNRPRPRWV
jgi:transposase InsO family protein